MGRDPGALEYTRWGSIDMTPEDVQAHAGHGVTRLVVPRHPLTCASNASRSQRSPPRTTSAEHPAHNQPPSKSQTTRHLPDLRVDGSSPAFTCRSVQVGLIRACVLLARFPDRAFCASITCVAALCPGPSGGGGLIARGAAGDLGTALRFRFAR